MEGVLDDLRARLQELCRLPLLPADWHSSSAMIAAEGYHYGGDFYLAREVPHALDAGGGPGLVMVLVDVCGHGPRALPDAVAFAGALGGILAAAPVDAVMTGANDYLLDLPDPEAMATAVQVEVEYATGRYRISNAGHPPVLRWCGHAQDWLTDTATGTALGVLADPELSVSEGVLAAGDCLLFYTDGVVESRAVAIDAGIAWLQAAAAMAMAEGAARLPAAIIEQVPPGDDDRAVLTLCRGE